MTTYPMTSLIAPPEKVTIDVYGRNPLADDYRQVNATTYDLAQRKAGPPPKMFTGGTADLPAFVASGFDPAMLLRLPFTCRHFAAAVESRSQIARLFEELANEPYAYLAHQGLTEAISRLRDWASGRMDRNPNEQASAPGLYDQLFGSR